MVCSASFETTDNRLQLSDGLRARQVSKRQYVARRSSGRETATNMSGERSVPDRVQQQHTCFEVALHEHSEDGPVGLNTKILLCEAGEIVDADSMEIILAGARSEQVAVLDIREVPALVDQVRYQETIPEVTQNRRVLVACGPGPSAGSLAFR